jgi:thioredoxin:protein disulfide reductase
MQSSFNLILVLLFSVMPFIANAQTENEGADPLQIEGRVEPFTLYSHQPGRLILNLSLPEGYHAYEDQFEVEILEPDGFQYGQYKISPVVKFYDKFSKKNRRGIRRNATIRINFEAPAKVPVGTNRVLVEVTYQACSKTFCLFPKTKEVSLPLEWKGSVTEESPKPIGVGSWDGETVKKALDENLLLAFILVFLSGILTSFTPCIFPMIPITLAILGHDSQKRSRKQNFLLSLSYVHGIATTYSLLGVIAASSGLLFGSALGHPVVLSILCGIFLLMALSMYGVYEIQVPAGIRNKFTRHKSGAHYTGAYFSGIIAGVVASPCVGPVLVTLLTFVASTQSKVLGFFLLFTYAMGLGVIFMILGAFTELARKLPRSGPWMDGMKFLLGSLMLGAFFYYLGFLISERWHDALLGVSLITLGSFFGAFIKGSSLSKFHRLQKGFMQAVLVVGIVYVVIASFDLRPFLTGKFTGPVNAAKPVSDWLEFDENLLIKARQEGKPVIIDFFAEWCLACHELDEKTFSEKSVKKALKNVYLLRFDATKESERLRALRRDYKIVGLPTVVFIDKNGVWQKDLSLTEFESADKFLDRIKKLKSH